MGNSGIRLDNYSGNGTCFSGDIQTAILGYSEGYSKIAGVRDELLDMIKQSVLLEYYELAVNLQIIADVIDKTFEHIIL